MTLLIRITWSISDLWYEHFTFPLTSYSFTSETDNNYNNILILPPKMYYIASSITTLWSLLTVVRILQICRSCTIITLIILTQYRPKLDMVSSSKWILHYGRALCIQSERNSFPPATFIRTAILNLLICYYMIFYCNHCKNHWLWSKYALIP